MALEALVTKSSVSQVMPSLWMIAFNLTLTDDTVEVVNRDFSVKYRQGEDIEAKSAELLSMIQKVIDAYKAEQVIFDHSKMTTVETYLNANLVV